MAFGFLHMASRVLKMHFHYLHALLRVLFYNSEYSENKNTQIDGYYLKQSAIKGKMKPFR